MRMYLKMCLKSYSTLWEMVCSNIKHHSPLTSCVSCVSSGGAAGPRLNNNQLYKFSYTTEVLVDRTRGSKEGSAGYRISSDVDINLVWRDPSSKDDQLIQLAVCRSTHMCRQNLMSCHRKFICTSIK